MAAIGLLTAFPSPVGEFDLEITSRPVCPGDFDEVIVGQPGEVCQESWLWEPGRGDEVLDGVVSVVDPGEDVAFGP
jgi:hypothetical protein